MVYISTPRFYTCTAHSNVCHHYVSLYIFPSFKKGFYLYLISFLISGGGGGGGGGGGCGECEARGAEAQLFFFPDLQGGRNT